MAANLSLPRSHRFINLYIYKLLAHYFSDNDDLDLFVVSKKFLGTNDVKKARFPKFSS